MDNAIYSPRNDSVKPDDLPAIIEAAGKVEAALFAIARKHGGFQTIKVAHAALYDLVEAIEARAHGK